MEKVCEFCKVLRPIVYCQADAAQLCLSCDAKVHSANALSNRHLRSLLCDSCRFRPASFHCSSNNHNIYSCPSCDKALHTTLPQHQRHPIHSYTGCPSVKDFSALWDLDSINNVSHSSLPLDQINNNKISGRKQQPIRFLVQQIMDLEKLQLSDEEGSNGGCHTSPLQHSKHKNDMSPSSSLTNAVINKKIVEESSSNDNTARLQDTVHPRVLKNHPLNPEDLSGEPFPTNPFTLESLQSSSVEGSDSFWQCKIQTNQFSAQNMQDLGVCEDLSHDDFNIPDVDVTFQNYEELFGGENINNGMYNSSVDREVSPDMSSIIRGLKEEDGAASSYYTNMSSGRSDHFSPSTRSYMFPYSISQDHNFHDEVDAGQTLTLNTSREDGTNRYKNKARVPDKKKKKQHASASAFVENADVRKRVTEQEVRMQRFRYH